MNKFTIKDLIVEVTIAAIYVCLVLAFYFMSFDAIQFRIAEALLVLVFLNKKHTIGIVTGTFLANWMGSIGIVDALFGSLATLIVCLLLMPFKRRPHIGLAIIPALINGVVVSFELALLYDLWDQFLINMGWVALGEAVVMIVIGIPLLMTIKKMKLDELLHLN